MQNDNTPYQNGAVIFWKQVNNTGESQSLTLPDWGSGEAVDKSVSGEFSKIAMSDIPSATTITLSQGTGSGKVYIKLKATHQPASLDRTEFQYLMDSYTVGDFISEGLGLTLVEKEGKASRAGIDCHVQLSKAPPAA
ncbi:MULTISPECIES: hypothetical protein [Pseudomonas]|uniref:hypothetical protein n=1 Tax=Pseudomonas TaxID=286 RepID=UPI0018A3F5FF|nr:hypothetical protein [Pseudomonas monteilii]BBV96043.1 hypothetical protein STW0522PSE72_13940 [Pseudomonas monteilii]